LEITQLHYQSPKTSFQLHISDLQIQDQSITTLIGPNGSGKSTFLNLLHGGLKPKKGTILYQNKSLTELTPKEKGRLIGYMPQQQQFPNYLSVKEIVKMGRLPYQGVSLKLKAEDEMAIEQALLDCQLLELEQTAFGLLSGGQQQRVRLATILAQKPEYIFLDEPTTYLDIQHQYLFLNRLKGLQQERNFTVVMVLHDVQQALLFSDYWIGMKEGKVAFKGQPQEEEIEKIEQLFSWPFLKQELANQVILTPKESQK